MSDTGIHPTIAAARLYLSRGWSPMPLAAGTKWPPPAGVTGWRGRYTTAADLQRVGWDWTANLAVRMPPDVVGVDVDVYAGGADGLAELEQKHGPLPPTVWSTSRDDGSGIALFRVPNGTVLATDPAQGIDMIQAHHRYVVCAPSIHPKTGQRYRWVDEQSEEDIDGPPVPDELPALPWGWIDGLAMDKRPGVNAATPLAAQAFFDTHNHERLAPHRLGGLRTMLARAKRGGRHDTLVAVMCMAMREAAAGCYTADEAVSTINAWWVDVMTDEPHRRESGEFGGAVLWAVAQAEADTERVAAIRAEATSVTILTDGEDWAPDTPERPSGVDTGTGEIQQARNLPDAFWEARASLSHIRQAAHARARSGDAVLLATLARICATIPPGVALPPIVGSAASLNMLGATVGTSGAGKTTAGGVARELYPINRADVVADRPMGSGEGLVELYFEWVTEEGPDGKRQKVKRQTKTGMFMYLDEGQALSEMGNRKGATLLPTMRTAWSGDTLGQSNATQETHRVIPAHAYRLALLVGFQVEYAAGLLADAAGGTPQRFVFACANDPTIPDDPPDWPGPLHHEPPIFVAGQQIIDVAADIAADIRARNLLAARGQIALDPLDSHRDLVRLKIAALLGYLEGRLSVDKDDWELAGMVMDTSNAVRSWVAEAARQKAARDEMTAHRRAATREVVVAESAESRALKSAAKSVGRRVHKVGGTFTRSAIGHAVASKHKELVALDDIIDEAERSGWITPTGEGSWGPGESIPA